MLDLQLAAVMPANGVTRIYTFNADDHEFLGELTVITPGQSPLAILLAR